MAVHRNKPEEVQNQLYCLYLTALAMSRQQLGGNIVLASLLSLLSYVPFELVAKGSLAVCAFLFVVDPFPPLSRLISLVSLVVIALLSRAYRNWNIQRLRDEEQDELHQLSESSDDANKKDQ